MFLTEPLLVRVIQHNLKPTYSSANRFWRRSQWLRFAQKRFGRQKTCYSIGVRYVNRGMMNATLSRVLKKMEQKALWDTRIDAAAQEHGLECQEIREGLARCHIQLDRKMLSEIAIYEPRTFQSLTEIAKKKLEQEGLNDPRTPLAKNIVTRGLL